MLELGDDVSDEGGGLDELGELDCCFEQADTRASVLRHNTRILRFIDHLTVYQDKYPRQLHCDGVYVAGAARRVPWERRTGSQLTRASARRTFAWSRRVFTTNRRKGPMPKESARWVSGSDVIPMFPTFVWKTQLEAQLRKGIDAKMLAALARMRRALPPLAPGHGWQSIQTLHTLEEFQDLVSCVRRAAAGILRFLKVGYDAFEISACWATVLATGAAHRAHHHPNNYLSGVYYLRTHPGADSINFHDPRSQTGIIRPPVVALTADNTDQVVVRVQNGTLLLFPAYLQHSIDANASAEERVSISFNIMFCAFTENLSKPLWGAHPPGATRARSR
ncbi:MAG: hypothetical protein JWM63_567 [Gammaproteobacteria bacterium]|nr:hypothetical protein [Gammaproteobacteria bacterium]